MRTLVSMLLAAGLCSACASYVTPGGAARLADLNPPGAAAEVSRQPSPSFPVRLGLIRVQAPQYVSFSSAGIGEGRFSVVDAAELLDDAQLQKLAAWTQVARASTLDTALLPASFESLDDLRLAAAKMQVDILLAYTVDTTFKTAARQYEPRSKLSLGDKPEEAAVASTVSAAFVDVRTGFTYATVRAQAQAGDLAAAWTSATALDGKRLAVERQAFGAFAVEAEKTWALIVGRYR